MPGPIPLSRFAPLALALALSGVDGARPGVALGDDAAPVLIVTGRVIDAQGKPIPKARVVTRDKRLSAMVDESGRYTLTLPLARADMLARYPYALALRAEAKGWTIVLPTGDSGLGLELRTVAALDGTNRCFARSNDVRVAAAAARAVGSAKEPAAVTVNFVGEKGEREPGADPELTQTAQVALSALALPPLPRDSISVTVTERPVVEAPVVRASAPPSPPSTAPAEPPVTQAVPSAPPAHVVPPATPPVAPSTPPVSAAPRPAAAPTAASERSARQAEQKRIAREEKEREDEAKEKRAREEALARIAAEAAKESAKGSAIEKVDREREEELAKARARLAKRQEKELLAIQQIQERRAEVAAKEAKEAARIAARDSAVTAANAERAAKEAQQAAREAARDSARTAANAAREAKAREQAARVAAARVAKATAAKPTPAAKDEVAAERVPETPAAAEKPPVAESPRPATVASKPRRDVVIHPAPDGEGRVRSAPFVIGRKSTAAAAALDSCSCRIRGTIEVRSNEPLGKRLKAVVSLAWFPAAADTVELFMGSPRAFTLPAAPCGPQRLKVTFPGRERFVVLTRDAVAGFRCDGVVPVHQVRIVLGPR